MGFEQDHQEQVRRMRSFKDSDTAGGYVRKRDWENLILELGEKTEQTEEHLGRLVQGRILEVGCGEGRALSELHRLFPRLECVGIDIMEETWSTEGTSKLRGDVHRLPFDDGTFDFVFAAYTFPYVTDKLRGLAEMHRVLRRGGLGYVPLHPGFLDPIGPKLIPSSSQKSDIYYELHGYVVEIVKRRATNPFARWQYTGVRESKSQDFPESVISKYRRIVRRKRSEVVRF